jgi:hypothetical protein
MSDQSRADDNAGTFLETASIFNTTLQTFFSSINFELEHKDHHGKPTP